MSPIALSLADCIASFWSSVRDSSGDCRIVFPAPTKKVGRSLHEELLARGLPSYLVLEGRETRPSEVEKTLFPDAVTSIRDGSFVCVVEPGALSRLQDSISGTGGGIRGLAVPDEWPWRDNGPEFSFEGAFFDKWASHAGIPPGARDATRALVMLARDSLEASPERAETLFDEILHKTYGVGEADSAAIVRLLACSIGLPYPGNGVDLVNNSLPALVRDYRHLTPALALRMRGAAAREAVKENIGPAFTKVEQPSSCPDEATFYARVQELLDRLGQLTKQHRSALALRNVLPKDIADWGVFSLTVLQQLFDVAVGDPLEVEVKWVEAGLPGVIVFEGGQYAVAAQSEMPSIDLVFSSAAHAPLNALAKAGQRRIGEVPVPAAVTRAELPIQIPSGVSCPPRIRVTLSTDDAKQAAQGILRLEKRQPGRDSFLAIPITDTATGTVTKLATFEMKTEEKIESESYDATGPFSIYVISSGSEEVSASVADVTLTLEDVTPGVVRIDVDPGLALFSAVQSELLVRVGGRLSSLTFGSGGLRRGECVLEAALATAIQAGKSSKLTDSLLRAFEGKAEPLPLLGVIDGAHRKRFDVARSSFESADRPWLPVVLPANLEGPIKLTDCASVRMPDGHDIGLPAGFFSPSGLDGEGKDVLDQYVSARSALLGAMRQRVVQFSLASYPLYAASGLYSDGADDISTRLANYVAAFAGIQRWLANSSTKVDYAARFHMTFLDSVVVLNGLEPSFCVLGPWHPMVVAKRACVGNALIAMASRGSGHKDRWLNRLASLLRDVVGFRWFAGLGSISSQQIPFIAESTNDPGWVACMSTSASSAGFTSEMEELLGLSVRRGGASEGGSFGTYLHDFRRAFPSKRAIVLKASSEYSLEEITDASRRLLSSSDGSISEAGASLPGGIHIVVDGYVPKGSELAPWGDPVVCVYPKSGPGLLSSTRVDVNLVPSACMTAFQQRRADEECLVAPRGKGSAAVLHLPVRRLDQGAGALSVSRLIDNVQADAIETDGLGSAFTIAASEMQKASGGGMVVCLETHQAHGAESDAVWTILPGDSADPAVLLEWASQESGGGAPKVLWDFKMAMTRSSHSYFVMSEIPKSLVANIKPSQVFRGPEMAGPALLELASLGLALGSEAFKSHTRALGVVGLIGCTRFTTLLLKLLMAQEEEAGDSVAAFILPIDSFQDLLGGEFEGDFDAFDSDSRRADLIAVICKVSDLGVEIACCSVESKYCGAVYGDSDAGKALSQARKSLERLTLLSSEGRADNALAERLALSRLVDFGLRLNGGAHEELVLSVSNAILSGRYKTSTLGSQGLLLVSTEIGLGESKVVGRVDGVWVRLSPSSWPGERNAERVNELLGEAASLLSPPWARRRAAMAHMPPPQPAQPNRDEVSSGSVHPSAERRTVEAAPARNVFKALLGVSDDGHPVEWVSGENPNHNLMVTGSSGNGKTQLVKSIVCQMREQGLPVLILDFKNDFASDPDFLRTAELDVQFVSFDGLPYNPLIPFAQPDPRTGTSVFHIGQHIAGIVAAFQKPYGLGEQQAAALKEAIRDAMHSCGFPSSGIATDINGGVPDFREVGEALKSRNERAYNRLDPIFDLEIFRDTYKGVGFETLLGRGLVIDLSSIQSASIQNTLAQLVVYSAHRYLNSLRHSPVVKQLLVFDEAHRISRSEDVERLVRECRAYGLAVMLSSQYPDDFPADTASNLAAKVLHGNGPDTDRIRAIQGMLGLPPETDRRLDMPVFSAVMAVRRGPPTFARTVGYPHWLILQALRDKDHSFAELATLPGIHENKLDQTLEHLLAMRLVAQRGDLWGLV